MRAYSVEVICNLVDSGEDVGATFEVDIRLEDGMPLSVTDTIPEALRSVATQIEQQMASGEANVFERH
jgi:hypothetical protein